MKIKASSKFKGIQITIIKLNKFNRTKFDEFNRIVDSYLKISENYINSI